MAMSTTTAYMPQCKELLPSLLKPALKFPCSVITHKHINVLFTTYKKAPLSWRFLAKSSEDASASSDAATTTTTTTSETWEGGESSSVEVAKGPPSLISALNVEKALRGIAITDVDHYGKLGLPRGCTYEQVGAAYKNKVKEISNQGLDEEELNKELELLKESYTILSSEEERRLYDWSLARNEVPDRYMWPFEVDITQAPKGTPPPPEPEDVGPTVLVGYFLLGWFVLAFALSIILNL